LHARPVPWYRRLSNRVRRRLTLGRAAGLVSLLVVLGIGLGSLPLAGQPVQSSAIPLLSDEELEAHQALAKMQNDLSRGVAVKLVGSTGPPRWHRWRTGKEQGPLTSGPNFPMHISSWATAMLEVVPDPGREHYHLQAEVRYRTGQFGYAGLYFLA